MTHNDEERRQWVENDEELYNLWRSDTVIATRRADGRVQAAHAGGAA